MKEKRLLELDALRGIAAISVVLYHYTFRYNDKFGEYLEVPFVFHIGQFGVHLFFIISGFVITMTLDRCKTIKDFLLARFVRLYPTYWAAIILTVIIVSIYPLPGWNISIYDIGINLTMLQHYLKVDSVDGVYWTLAVELNFYCLMAIWFLLGKNKSLEKAGLFFLICSLVVNLLVNIYPHTVMFFYLKHVLLWGYGNLFFAGIIFYKIYVDSFTFNRFLMLCFCFFYEVVFFDLISMGIILGLFLGLYVLLINKLSFLKIPALIFVGQVSYGWYLLHQNIGYVILKFCMDYQLNNKLVFIIPVIVSFTMAVCLYYLIDKYLSLKIKIALNRILE